VLFAIPGGDSAELGERTSQQSHLEGVDGVHGFDGFGGVEALKGSLAAGEPSRLIATPPHTAYLKVLELDPCSAHNCSGTSLER
jgi:hypothetical protein